MMCSIDARWAPGDIVSSGVLVPVLDPDRLREPSEQDQTYNAADGFLPKNLMIVAVEISKHGLALCLDTYHR